MSYIEVPVHFPMNFLHKFLHNMFGKTSNCIQKFDKFSDLDSVPRLAWFSLALCISTRFLKFWSNFFISVDVRIEIITCHQKAYNIKLRLVSLCSLSSRYSSWLQINGLYFMHLSIQPTSLSIFERRFNAF